MPFKSQAQRRYLYSKHPEIAKRWAEHTPAGAALPERAGGGPDAKPDAKPEDGPKAPAKRAAADRERHEIPGYRPANPTGPRCSACANFDHPSAACTKYARPVDADAVCDAFEQVDVGTDRVVAPAVAPGVAAPDWADGPLDAAGAFKFGFLHGCAEAGLGVEEAAALAEAALAACMSKEAAPPAAAAAAAGSMAPVKAMYDWAAGLLGRGLNLAGSVAKPVGEAAGNVLTAALVGAPIAAGVAGGSAAAAMNRGDTDPEAVKNLELLDEYERLAEEAEQRNELRNRAGDGSLIRVG